MLDDAASNDEKRSMTRRHVLLLLASAFITMPLSAEDKALPAWVQESDPKTFVLQFYKWYYEKIRELKTDPPVWSKRKDIKAVLTATVSPAILQTAKKFYDTNGEEGTLPFVPGNDPDDFWGDHGSIDSAKPEAKGERMRVVISMKGTTPGYEHMNAKDSVVLSKQGSGWRIEENPYVESK